jgi:hypothetical protein
MALTEQETRQEAEKFLAWLRRKYPVYTAQVKVLYLNKTELRAGVGAMIYQYGNVFKIHVATRRDFKFVLRGIAHEFEHFRQVMNEGIPMSRIRTQQEKNAWFFAMMVLREYKKEDIERWTRITGEEVT